MKKFLITIFSLTFLSISFTQPSYAELPQVIRNKINDIATSGAIRQNIKENLKNSGLLNKAKNMIEKKLVLAAHISGTLTAINNNILTINAESKDYQVTVTDKTQVRRKFWGKAELAEFSVGDKVNVIGKWTNDEKTQIEARLVRNVSIQKRFGVFFGDVLSKTDDSFVIKSINRGDETVYVSSSTKYLNRKEQSISYNDIQIGHRVRIKGLWNNTLSKITEVAQIKDFTIPLVKPSLTPTPNP